MVIETKMSTSNSKNKRADSPDGSSSARSPSRSIDLAGNLSDVAHDITQLVELQGQLLMVDVKEAQQKLKLPIVLAIAGALIALCAMPLLLVAIAQALVLAGLQLWAAYAIVSVVGLAVGGLLLWQSWRSLKESALVLDRSRAEFSQNVEWLKQMLKLRSEAGRMRANC